MPLEQVQEKALKQYLEEVISTTEKESIPPSKEEESVEKKLKKWTPPGYTRRINKRIIKQPNEAKEKGDKREYTPQKPFGTIDGARSILDVPDIRMEQKE